MWEDRVLVADVTPVGEGLISAFIVVGDEKTAVVDPGPSSSAKRLIQFIREEGLTVDYIVPTHIHLDHGGGSCLLSGEFKDSIVYVHPRGAPHLADPTKLWNASRRVLGHVAEVYGEPTPCEESRIRSTSDGERLDLGSVSLVFIHTPGHASHHQSVWVPELKLLFSGDSAGVILFKDGGIAYIPTTPPPFKPDLYLESLEKMMRLDPLLIAPTHYGIHSDAASYLEKHKRQVKEWVQLGLDLARQGVSDPQVFLDRVKRIDENALFFLENENPIVQGSFIHTTAVGIMDYAMRRVSG
ncbi:MAG: MBL fold metallo-hydrolase [Desulfurococcales archaeon]|nr:MBL fold metallo-hydrolase [Desulfurococcales archaeon]